MKEIRQYPLPSSSVLELAKVKKSLGASKLTVIAKRLATTCQKFKQDEEQGLAKLRKVSLLTDDNSPYDYLAWLFAGGGMAYGMMISMGGVVSALLFPTFGLVVATLALGVAIISAPFACIFFCIRAGYASGTYRDERAKLVGSLQNRAEQSQKDWGDLKKHIATICDSYFKGNAMKAALRSCGYSCPESKLTVLDGVALARSRRTGALIAKIPANTRGFPGLMDEPDDPIAKVASTFFELPVLSALIESDLPSFIKAALIERFHGVRCGLKRHQNVVQKHSYGLMRQDAQTRINADMGRIKATIEAADSRHCVQEALVRWAKVSAAKIPEALPHYANRRQIPQELPRIQG